MTVKELIKELSKLPQTSQVFRVETQYYGNHEDLFIVKAAYFDEEDQVAVVK